MPIPMGTTWRGYIVLIMQTDSLSRVIRVVNPEISHCGPVEGVE